MLKNLSYYVAFSITISCTTQCLQKRYYAKSISINDVIFRKKIKKFSTNLVFLGIWKKFQLLAITVNKTFKIYFKNNTVSDYITYLYVVNFHRVNLKNKKGLNGM